MNLIYTCLRIVLSRIFLHVMLTLSALGWASSASASGTGSNGHDLEIDDYPESAVNDSIHRVWVRSVDTGRAIWVDAHKEKL